MGRVRDPRASAAGADRCAGPVVDPVLRAWLAVTELVDRLGVIGRLDAAIGPIKQRDRGYTGGQLLVGIAAAQLAGEDFLVGLDRQRADAAGQELAPVPGLASTTAAGLARRFTDGQWRGGGDRARRCRTPPRWRAARGRPARARGAVRAGDDRPGHHRRGGLRPPQARGGVQPPGPAGRAPARGDLGRHRDGAGRGPAGRARGSPPRRRRAAAPGAGRAARRGPGRADPAARRRRLLRRAAGPRRPVRRGRVRHRRPADRAAVAAARRRRRGRLDRRDRHDRRAGRGGRLLPELVAGRDPAADPPGPPRRRPPGRCRPIRGPGGAAPCTPTSAPCPCPSSPRPTPSTATRSSSPTSTCPPPSEAAAVEHWYRHRT